MEELFREVLGYIALAVEAGAALFIAVGAIEAFVMLASRLSRGTTSPIPRKEVWVRFAVWLLLALEFELAADVLRSAIAPTWSEIGQLASIAVIRTFLNYFLEKDIEAYRAEREVGPGASRAPAR